MEVGQAYGHNLLIEVLRLIQCRLWKKEEEEEDGEGSDLLRYVTWSFRVLAIHGKGPCLDRSSSRRKELDLERKTFKLQIIVDM
ncbi:hypothetical protein F8388_006150 [Cannabis sativa]|uniref:Uncharacterized protein n=1 Tax=Cannabis sativa TaxID=3483 RepID=A0A7J6G9C5_CANSA|nr:hypothetical protein F8388_006150 [Cannabis sativa]